MAVASAATRRTTKARSRLAPPATGITRTGSTWAAIPSARAATRLIGPSRRTRIGRVVVATVTATKLRAWRCPRARIRGARTVTRCLGRPCPRASIVTRTSRRICCTPCLSMRRARTVTPTTATLRRRARPARIATGIVRTTSRMQTPASAAIPSVSVRRPICRRRSATWPAVRGLSPNATPTRVRSDAWTSKARAASGPGRASAPTARRVSPLRCRAPRSSGAAYGAKRRRRRRAPRPGRVEPRPLPLARWRPGSGAELGGA